MKPMMITIPEPCHENWNEMTAAEKGRFCSSCSKEVVDFSNMNDAQIQVYLNNASGKVCGRFDDAQVNRVLAAPVHNTGLFKHIWKMLLPGFFFSVKAAAQNTEAQGLQLKDSLIRANPQPKILGMIATHTLPENKNEQIVKGKVIDADNDMPLPGVFIQIKGSRKGTVTDSAGNFWYKIPGENKNALLVISYVGYETKEMNIKDVLKQNGQLKIKMRAALMGEVVVTHKPRNAKKQEVKPVKVKETYAVVNDKVKIYPNPVETGSSCSVSFGEVEKGNYTAQLTDINGKMIQQSAFYVPGENFLFHLDLNKEVIAGAYLLRVVNADGKLFYNGKIVVQ